MNLLFRIVYGSACRSTHHKFAMDALRRLPLEIQQPWTRAFLLHYQDYLRGAKDPDDRFRDFTNHVLHVGDNYWGGAPAAARKWYEMARTSLSQREWGHGIYACGVLSHYLTDPVMPFHTGQSDREVVIHRACEWSITKSYEAIHQVTLLRVGYPTIELSHESDWLEQAVRMGAECGYHYYDDLIEHYQFDRGVKDPPSGLDPFCREILAKLFGVSIQLWAEVLTRLLREANVMPPSEDLSFPTLFAALDVPQKWIVNQFADAQERELVRSIYNEWKETGRVVKNLPLDDKMVQEAYENEVLGDEEGRWRSNATPATQPLPVRWHSGAEGTTRSRGEETLSATRPLAASERVALTNAVSPVALAPGAHGVPRPHFAASPRSEEKTVPIKREASTPQHSIEQPAKPITPVPLPASASFASSRTMPPSAETKRSEAKPAVPIKPDLPCTSERATSTQPARSAGAPPSPQGASTRMAQTSIGTVQVQKQELKPGATLAPVSKVSASTKPKTPVSASSKPCDSRTSSEAVCSTPASNQRAMDLKFYLELSDDVEKAPSIGPKTAKRLHKIGIKTVRDLLNADCETASGEMDARWVTADIVGDWQDQARLVCSIPGLRGHDAQLLVACERRNADQVARANVDELLHEVLAFAGTPQGQSILRSGKEPDRAEITGWIQAARQSRSLRAA